MLVDGQGNFGSIDDDPARRCGTPRPASAARDRAAARHRRRHGRLRPNYDESTQEPLVLPARFPNLLVNGTSGIAVGMATNIPPHNLREVAGAVAAYIDDPRSTSPG
jgi:DNA gyrase subunit A